MKLYYVRTNAYDMLIADHGDHCHFVAGLDFNVDDESNALQFLTSNVDGLAYNSHEWEETEETVEELTDWQGIEILAEIDAEEDLQ